MTIRDMNGLTPYDIISEKLVTPGADRKFLKKYAKLCRPRQLSHVPVALQSSLNALTPRSPGRHSHKTCNSSATTLTGTGSTSSSRSESPSESGASASSTPASRAPPSTASSGPCAEAKTSLMGVVRHPMNLFRTCKAK